MTLQELIPLALTASIFLLVFALGLQSAPQDAFSLFGRPGLLAKSILALNGIMLVLAVIVAAAFDLPPAVKIAMVALAVSPLPPVLPNKQKKAGGSSDYITGLLVAASLIAIVLVPLAIELVGAIFGKDFHVPLTRIASVVGLTILLPLAAGMLAHTYAPALAARAARPISIVATVVLAGLFVLILFRMWPLFETLVGQGALIVLIAFSVIGTIAGHLLGGPDPDDRTVLALAAGARHPGVAVAVAGITYPDEKAAIAVVVFHLVIATLVAAPYVAWRRRSPDAETPAMR